MLLLNTTELRFDGEVLVDGEPLACPDCPMEHGFAVRTGPMRFGNSPAWVNCPDGHGWEELRIPNGLLNAAHLARSVRTKSTGTSATTAEWNGHQLAGGLALEWCVDDIRTAATTLWNRGLKPGAKRRFRRHRRAVVSTLTATAKDVVGKPSSAALAAAWKAVNDGVDQADEKPPARKVRKCPSCKGKGHHQLKTHIHTEATVPCALCHGTGDRDQILAL